MANGQIDHIKITTDDNLDDNLAAAGLTMTVSTNALLDAEPYVSIIGGGSDSDNIFYIELAESGSSDTHVTPTVTLTANTTLSDTLGNNMATDGGVAATDKAAPILLSATSSLPVSGTNIVDGTIFTLNFSENMAVNNGTGTTIGNFSLVSATTTGSTLTFDASTTTVTITFSGVTTSNDWAETDLINMASQSTVVDTATTPNAAIPVGANVAIAGLSPDSTPPTITARETVDTDGNGQIDYVRITTDEDLDDDFTGLTMTVDTFTLDATPYVSSRGGANDNDNVFYIALQESGNLDTNVTPTVTLTVNTTLSDAADNNIVTDAGVAATDKAAPILLSASSNKPLTGTNVTTGSVFTLTFSENMAVDNGTGTAISDFTLIDATTTGTVPTFAASTNTVTITFPGATTSSDWDVTDKINIADQTTMVDSALNPARMRAADVSISGLGPDTTAPFGYSVTIDQPFITTANETALSFTFANAEVDATYNYSINDGHYSTANITGSGTITLATQQITPINVSTLDDNVLTLTVYLTDPASNQGGDATDQVLKNSNSIYRSVAVNATTAIVTGADGGGNNLNVTLGATSADYRATFANGLPDNVGVGTRSNMIRTATAQSMQLPHSRSVSPTSYHVFAEDGTVPTVTATADDQDWSIFRSYTTLVNAEAGTVNTGIDGAVNTFDGWAPAKI